MSKPEAGITNPHMGNMVEQSQAEMLLYKRRTFEIADAADDEVYHTKHSEKPDAGIIGQASQTYINLAVAMARMGDPVAAKKIFVHAKELADDPEAQGSKPHSYQLIVDGQTEAGLFEEAAVTADQITQDDVRVYQISLVGKGLAQAGRVEEANRILESIAGNDLDQKLGRSCVYAALAVALKDDPEAAQEYLSRAKAEVLPLIDAKALEIAREDIQSVVYSICNIAKAEKELGLDFDQTMQMANQCLERPGWTSDNDFITIEQTELALGRYLQATAANLKAIDLIERNWDPTESRDDAIDDYENRIRMIGLTEAINEGGSARVGKSLKLNRHSGIFPKHNLVSLWLQVAKAEIESGVDNDSSIGEAVNITLNMAEEYQDHLLKFIVESVSELGMAEKAKQIARAIKSKSVRALADSIIFKAAYI